MAKGRISVSKQCDYQSVDEETLAIVLRNRLAQYLKRIQVLINEFDLEIIVTQCSMDPRIGDAAIKFRLEGTLNNRRVDHSYGRHVWIANTHKLVPLLATLLIVACWKLIRKYDDNPFGYGIHGARLIGCIEYCMTSAEIHLNDILGLPVSDNSRRWKAIQRFCWFVPAFVTVPVVAYARHNGNDTNQAAALCVIASPFLFMAVFSAGYLIMPEDFFRTDARGRKALMFAGVSNIWVLRLLCAILAILLAGVGVMFLMIPFEK